MPKKKGEDEREVPKVVVSEHTFFPGSHPPPLEIELPQLQGVLSFMPHQGGAEAGGGRAAERHSAY